MDRDEVWKTKLSKEEMAAFADRLNRVRGGEELSWTCPFCGGSVGLLKKEDAHTTIGCNTCDMRISLDF